MYAMRSLYPEHHHPLSSLARLLASDCLSLYTIIMTTQQDRSFSVPLVRL